MNRKLLTAVAAVSLCLAVAPRAGAEAQAAKDYLKQAQDLIANRDTEAAAAKLDLADAELDGVDAAAKASIAASIKSARQSIAAASLAGDADKYHRKIGLLMDDAEASVGNQVTWPVAAASLKELFDDPAAQASIPDEIAAAKRKFATFDKLNAKKTAVLVGARVEDVMKQFDAKWAEEKPKFTDPNSTPGDKSTAIDDMTRALDDAKQEVARLPADGDEAKAYNARLDKVGAEFTQIALADKAKDVLAHLKDSFASYKEEYDGWDKEPAEGPTWAAYQQNSGDAMDALNAPKGKGLISRTDEFLKDLANNDEYKSVAASPDLKAFVGQLAGDRATAYAAMLKRVNPLVTSAIATGGEGLSRLKDSVRLTLGEDSPEGKALQESIQKRIDGGVAAVAAGEDAQKALYQKMTAAAAAAWPDIVAKFPAEEGFDPGDPAPFKGKTIKITTDNLMGYRFKPGDFAFATTLSGMPVAARFDPALAAAIKSVEAKIGRNLGDSDDDGKFEIYAVVTGQKGRLLQKKQAEGEVKVDGQSVGTVTTDYADPVDAPIITIVAAKCGPFAGGKGAGMMQADGTMSK